MISPSSSLAFSSGVLQQLADDALGHARAKGASAAEVEVSESCGLSVTVRRGEVDTIEYNRDKGLSVGIYLGQRWGCASTSDFSARALRETVEAALSIARFTAEDPCAGLPEKEELATGEFPDLDLFHPWNLTTEEAIVLARRCEEAAFAADKRIQNSEGGSLSSQQGQFVLANSQGFLGGYPSSRHYLSCSVIAGKGERMQRDYWYSTHRKPDALETPEAIGQQAARRAVARLGAKKIAAGSFPVLFEAPLASGLLGHFVHAASGSPLYHKASFLIDQLGKTIFPDFFTLSERPHLPTALASANFDNEGVRTREREVVQNGILQGYFLNVYSARKLNLKTTANAGGNHNLFLRPGAQDLKSLLRQMGRGLLATELLGHGINYVTGDYSRGAAGFWIEDGEIAHPVEEITIAGNLRDMFRNLQAIGNDIDTRSPRQTGSWLISEMTIGS
ncbi:MAG: metalloprotease PmbA [Zoogloeaceae bacterium]|jgi:PmbA protein|nr:metalloprotease PmbA [Zoogloeaceae bacterium]